MLLVLKAHRELDNQCRAEAVAAGLEDLRVADVAYPLITKRMLGQWVCEWGGGGGARPISTPNVITF